MSMVPTCVGIVTVSAGEYEILGCTISSLVSLNVDQNFEVMFVLKANSKTGSSIKSHKFHNINIMNEHSEQTARDFADITKNDISKWIDFKSNTNYEISNSFIQLKCEISKSFISGGSEIFISKVLNFIIHDQQSPIIYHNRKFRNIVKEEIKIDT